MTTKYLSHIDQLREVETILHQFMTSYYKVKNVRQQLEQQENITHSQNIDEE